MYTGQFLKFLVLLGVSVSVLVSACSDQFEPSSTVNDIGNFSASIPGAIIQSRIDPSELTLTVTVDGENVPMTRFDNRWSGSISVPFGQTVQFSLRWSRTGIDIATLDRTFLVENSNQEEAFSNEDYRYPDDDGDNFSNLQEIDASPSTDANDPNSFPPSIGEIYENGDTGPGGGKVVYVTNGGSNGLEVALEDVEGLFQWGCLGTDVAGVPNIYGGDTETVFQGADNTRLIIAACGIDTAARAAADYVWPNGQTDGFLPNIHALDIVHDQREHVGNFASDLYWSSSEVGWLQFQTTAAWAIDFNPLAFRKIPRNKSITSIRVRAVRVF